MNEALSKRIVARIATLLFVVSGVVTIAGLLLPEPPGMNDGGVFTVGWISVVVGAVAWFMPWERWPRRAGLVLVAGAHLLIIFHNTYAGEDPYRYGIFFIVLSAWVGLAQPRGTMLWLAPLTGGAYVTPLLVGNYPLWAIASVLYVVPVCVLVGESLGWFAVRLTQAQEALKTTEERFRQQYKSSPLPAYSWRALQGEDDFVLVDCNDAADAYTKGHIRAKMGTLASTFFADRSDIVADLRCVLTEQRTLQREMASALNGAKTHLSTTYVFVAPDVVTIHTEDVTARRDAEAELTRLAFRDPLTGLANRALFSDRLEHALQRRPTDDTHVAVLFADLDNFKVINDSLGHHAGDALLEGVAERLRGCLRPHDTAARLGGDEFTALLESVTDPSEATLVADRFANALREPFELEGREVFISASIGIAVAAPRDRAEDVLRNADLALYGAKGAGKARHATFDQGMQKRALERLELETALRRAQERGELELFYQPIVSLATDEIVEAEALLRWRRPERGLIPPGEFIPLAEETGLIVPIGAWVLEEACRQAQQWRRERPRAKPLIVGVNLSARQLLLPDLVETVAAALRTSGLPAQLLKVEITESAVMHDADAAIKTLQALKALGVQLAIDDFGTGYSSLSYLKRFPVDTLKIDRSFVDGLGDDAQDTAIVRSVVALAQTLDLSLTAEGVETSQQADGLRDLGCQRAQGYLFARPVPAAEFAALLVEQRDELPIAA